MAGPPSIDYQPQSQAVILYQQAAFGVIASGTPPLSFQWRKDGVPIAGATNDQVVLAHPQFSDAGTYSVIVSNAENSVTSADAGLTVNAPKGGEIDCSFGCGASIDFTVECAAVQPDGKVLFGGCSFTIATGRFRGRLARLNADGMADFFFTNGLSWPDGRVLSLAVQSDGKLLIAGTLGVTRLNADGSLDSGWDSRNGCETPFCTTIYVNSLGVQSDGKVVVAGLFSTGPEISRFIQRLNADGTLDSGFQNGLSGVCCGHVSSVAVQSDDKVLIGGDFSMVNGVSRSRIARLNADGTLDNSFQNGLSGADGSVRTVAVESDGKVVIGGCFSSVNGVSRTNIARLNSDGTLDSGFQSDVGGVPDPCVQSLAVQSDGNVLIAGRFTTVNAETRNFVARLNADGSTDSQFQNGLTGTDSEVYLVTPQGTGKVIIVGTFTNLYGEGHNFHARLNADGSLDREFQNASGPSSSVWSAAVQSDGKVVVGGFSFAVNRVNRYGVARLDADGELDSGFQNGLSGANSNVRSITLSGDGKLLIGGDFSVVNGASRGFVAKLNGDGTLDDGFMEGLSGPDYIVLSVVSQADSKVIIGGGFGTVNEVTRSCIARLNPDGTLDGGFQNRLSGANGWVYSVATQSDGKVLIGGSFSTVNGATRNGIARLNADGTLDRGFQDGMAGVSDIAFAPVRSVALQSDGKVLIGGDFGVVNGVSRNFVARLNPDGTLDTGFRAGPNQVIFSVAVQSDGKVLIGGRFTTINGVSRNQIARLNTDGSLDSGFQAGLAGADGDIFSVALQKDGRVLIGGCFTTVNGMPAKGLARLWGSADVPPLVKSITRSAGEVNLVWETIPNRTYRVQYSGNLSGNNWTDMAGDVFAAGPAASKTDTTLSGAAQRFYRVVLLP